MPTMLYRLLLKIRTLCWWLSLDWILCCYNKLTMSVLPSKMLDLLGLTWIKLLFLPPKQTGKIFVQGRNLRWVMWLIFLSEWCGDDVWWLSRLMRSLLEWSLMFIMLSRLFSIQNLSERWLDGMLFNKLPQGIHQSLRNDFMRRLSLLWEDLVRWKMH